ncbi:alpha,alpha-trehalase TreF [Fulvivirga sp. M361]|uniref:alpha,alpha-trehalase TreF n=1 Tax=Fulvivirga sp. M361 TaxID=2594266 RepID=UPI001179AA7E|nr:alpha,alpha-trehalase TreF [Fulvivirga sp. M361]TRX59926.1 alpha,alpha-trehalase TreF [Fulvivirga sp. M361]
MNGRFTNILYSLTCFLAALFLCSCQGEEPKSVDFYSTALFKDVQFSGIFPDSKTFVDCTPKKDIDLVNTDYLNRKDASDFDLESFVLEHFELPVVQNSDFRSDTARHMKDHIQALWSVLTRAPDNVDTRSSLIPLPKSYIVPGGRFREIYYWDSYFTLEGLMASGKKQVAKNMVDNFSFLIDTMGFIPNGNRHYYRGRSQPPFYALMVNRLAHDDRDLFIGYLPAMVKEYRFWMRDMQRLSTQKNALRRVVLMPDGAVLNRYWDDLEGPRPESFKEDVELVESGGLNPEKAYKDLRAGAESGWDYSSRWFADGKDLSTIHTTDIVPIDLNCLLYFLELKIAQGYNWDSQLDSAQFYLEKAEDRKKAIQRYLWDEEDRFFIDYDFISEKKTGVLSLAGAYPLYFQIATKAQASSVLDKLETDFLKDGGFVTTLSQTGQQWDAPNGWAPLQWITVNAFYNYGRGEAGNDAASRWLKRNNEVYKATGKMMEKYNVVDTSLLAGGGEYPLQDGFGWTNGIVLAFEEILREKELIEQMTESL